MFEGLMRKAEELKRLAEEKAEAIDLVSLKAALDKSSDSLTNSAQKVSEVAGNTGKMAATAVSCSASRFSKAARDVGGSTRSAIAASSQKASETIDDAAVAAKSALIYGKEGASEIIDKYGPTVEKIVVHGLVGVAEEKLNDEKFMKAFLEGFYELLPTPIRLVMSRDIFLSFCLTYKDPILMKVEGYKERSSTVGSLNGI
jgi:hypothetical protein